ncbi:hypothetical protein DENIS_1287 [Desulfonema ishimotonii]|uniref:Uncharacterized protein n=1 Tax=Desulfonema ishimotonii TaxID=45657 RepID=A0A401FTP8_9BACT|nr:DUF6488 family protein [Desulfonema ishimotonii]GBC60336.1 hypothetical protein DENIS_1287 [Desulfonema ishimotonii]
MLNKIQSFRIFFIYFISFLMITMGTAPAFGHGGKSHADNAFTAFKALRKATAMYDKLIAKGTLPEIWETGLVKAEVAVRTRGGKSEYVVSFHRAEGDPKTVWFFFTRDGKYAGSNFTGQ